MGDYNLGIVLINKYCKYVSFVIMLNGINIRTTILINLRRKKKVEKMKGNHEGSGFVCSFKSQHFDHYNLSKFDSESDSFFH